MNKRTSSPGLLPAHHDRVYKTYAVAEHNDGGFVVIEIGSNLLGTVSYTSVHGVYEDYEGALLEAVRLGRVNSMYGL